MVELLNLSRCIGLNCFWNAISNPLFYERATCRKIPRFMYFSGCLLLILSCGGKHLQMVKHADHVSRSFYLLHCLSVASITGGVFLGLGSPFFNTNKQNIWDVGKRWTGIVGLFAAGGSLLYLSTQLESVIPEFEAIKKASNADKKHQIASWLHYAFEQNQRTAASSIGSSTPKPVELLEPSETEEFDGSFDSSTSSTQLASNERTELERTIKPFVEPVLKALEEGVSESKIIKDVMGFKSEKYFEGRQILDSIKSYLQLEN